MSRIHGLITRYRDMATDVAWSGISDLFNLFSNLLSFLLLGNTLALTTYGGYVGTYGVIAPLGAFTWSGLSLLILQRVIREKDDPQTVAARAFTLSLAQGLIAVVVATAIGSATIAVKCPDYFTLFRTEVMYNR